MDFRPRKLPPFKPHTRHDPPFSLRRPSVLLDHNADRELRNGEEKKTALRVALDHGREELADLLDPGGESQERLVGTAYTRPGTLGADADELGVTRTRGHDPASLQQVLSMRYAKSGSES